MSYQVKIRFQGHVSWVEVDANGSDQAKALVKQQYGPEVDVLYAKPDKRRTERQAGVTSDDVYSVRSGCMGTEAKRPACQAYLRPSSATAHEGRILRPLGGRLAGHRPGTAALHCT